MTIRICPERDAACPNGLDCPHVLDRYQCKPGWRGQVSDKATWVLFPADPTREMWAAMGNALVGYKQRHHDTVAEELWEGLKSAAPAPDHLREVIARIIAYEMLDTMGDSRDVHWSGVSKSSREDLFRTADAILSALGGA